MTKEQNEIIEKLEELVLEIYRNAGRLDRTIQKIKRDVKDESKEEANLTIMLAIHHRKDFKRLLDHDDLDEREAELWEELKATCKEGS